MNTGQYFRNVAASGNAKSCCGVGQLRVRDVWKRSDEEVIVRLRECVVCGKRYVSEERVVSEAEKKTIRR